MSEIKKNYGPNYYYRYEIRDDRKKDSLRIENMIESLRNEILGSIWERNMTIPRPRPMYPSNYTPDRVNVKDEPPAYNSFMPCRAEQKPSDYEGHDMNPKPDLYSTQTGNNFVSITDTAKNMTTTKVESYLSHLGDSYSSQTSENFPAHNLCDSLQSRDYIPQSNTSYGYNLYARGASESNSKSKISPCDIEHIKMEIMSSLKSELQETAKDLATDMVNYNHNAAMLPSINSELYQTHLYTQL